MKLKFDKIALNLKRFFYSLDNYKKISRIAILIDNSRLSKVILKEKSKSSSSSSFSFSFLSLSSISITLITIISKSIYNILNTNNKIIMNDNIQSQIDNSMISIFHILSIISHSE